MIPSSPPSLNLPILPARLTVEQAAGLLGFQPHDLPILVGAGLLRPLGRPSPNSIKYFATVELEALRQDIKWLARATDAIQSRWRRKNGTRPPDPLFRRKPSRRATVPPAPVVPPPNY